MTNRVELGCSYQSSTLKHEILLFRIGRIKQQHISPIHQGKNRVIQDYNFVEDQSERKIRKSKTASGVMREGVDSRVKVIL